MPVATKAILALLSPDLAACQAEGLNVTETARRLNLEYEKARRLCRAWEATTGKNFASAFKPRPGRMRLCMTCAIPFRSEGAHHRMCDDCRAGRYGANGRRTIGRGIEDMVGEACPDHAMGGRGAARAPLLYARVDDVTDARDWKGEVS